MLPSLGSRVDGHRLLYAGKIHWLYGDYEAGKTWFAMVLAEEILAQGKNVCYIDYEDDAAEVAGRFLALGVPPEVVKDPNRLRYIRPDESVVTEVGQDSLAALQPGDFSYVIIDGVTEAMGLEGLSPLDGKDVARWQRLIPRKIAKTCKAAVVCLDHIGKHSDNQKAAIGSVHKMGGVDGAAFKLVNTESFGRGLLGISSIFVTKDRPGGLRGIEGAKYDAKDRSHLIAELVHDARNPDEIKARVELPGRIRISPDSANGGNGLSSPGIASTGEYAKAVRLWKFCHATGKQVRKTEMLQAVKMPSKGKGLAASNSAISEAVKHGFIIQNKIGNTTYFAAGKTVPDGYERNRENDDDHSDLDDE